MATIRAIAATCDAVCHLLDTNAIADAPVHGLPSLQFRVYEPDDADLRSSFTGVTVLLYRVLPSLSHRTPPGRVTANGNRRRTKLPVDLHLLLTAWSRQRVTENIIVAWMMRTLEDYPILPANVLNLQHPGTFRADETVEIVAGEIPADEILHLWEVLGDKNYHITIPYVARSVFIESEREETAAAPVQIRDMDAALLRQRAGGERATEP